MLALSECAYMPATSHWGYRHKQACRQILGAKCMHACMYARMKDPGHCLLRPLKECMHACHHSKEPACGMAMPVFNWVLEVHAIGLQKCPTLGKPMKWLLNRQI